MSTAPITACLLHADYHAMTTECWGVTLNWYATHQEKPDREQRNDYQTAVERRILNQAREA